MGMQTRPACQSFVTNTGRLLQDHPSGASRQSWMVQSRETFLQVLSGRRRRLQLLVPTKLIEPDKHKKTAVSQRSELLNLLQHADFVTLSVVTLSAW